MKRLAILIAVLAMVLPLSGAVASHTCTVSTPIGCVSVNEGGYVLILDGAASNPGPATGFISVRNDGRICADDNGTHDNGVAPPDSSSPTCT